MISNSISYKTIYLLKNSVDRLDISTNIRKKAEPFDWNEVKNKWLEILK